MISRCIFVGLSLASISFTILALMASNPIIEANHRQTDDGNADAVDRTVAGLADLGCGEQ